MAIYGLFVGINNYEQHKIRALKGCINDVELITGILMKRYNISSNNIKTLLNERATKRNIIAGFQEHLAQAKANDTAIFYYSGHGSEEKVDPKLWPITPKGHNETFVCYDSRASELYDLADKEVRYLIHQLDQKGINVVTIVDSCHSGGATRALEEDSEKQPQTRQTPGNQRMRPMESYIFYDDPSAQIWINDFSLMPEGKHIALAACQNDQLSKEIYTAQLKTQGAFTYSFCWTMSIQQLPPSYRNLIDATAQRIKNQVTQQTPQVLAIGNADIHQTFLSDTLESVVYSIHFENNHWWLSAGISEGINKDALFEIQLDNNTHIEVIVLEPLSGISKISIEDDKHLNHKHIYNAVLLDPAITKLSVTFSGETASIQAIREVLKTSEAHHYIQESAHADYKLTASESTIDFQRKDAEKLLITSPIDKHNTRKPEILALNLAQHMALWHRTMNIVNAAGDMPNDLVELVIEQKNLVTDSYQIIEPQDDNYYIQYQPSLGQAELLKPHLTITLKLNTSYEWREDIHVALLFLDPAAGGIVDLIKEPVILRQKEYIAYDGNSKVKKHKIIKFPIKNNDSYTHTASIPKKLLAAGIQKSTDYFKLFYSNRPIEIGSLTQAPLSKLLKTYRSGNTRGLNDEDDEVIPDPSIFRTRTKTLGFTIYKPPAPQTLDSNKATQLIKNIRIQPHGLNALASIQRVSDATEEELAICLDFGNDASKSITESEQVTPDNPLLIEIDTPLNPNEVILAYTKDKNNDLLLPLGFSQLGTQSGKATVKIDSLPSPSAINAKSLGGSIMIYVKKAFHDFLRLEYDATQLAIPLFATPHSLETSGYETNTEKLRKAVSDTNKILLIIHGIIGDTKYMAGAINQEVNGKKLGEGYLTLTFDYENLNTPIPEIAEILSKKLSAIGLGKDHDKELIIAAHSMGGLVSRWMIEKEKHAPKVSQLIMCGTPNGGSPWSDVKSWAYALMTLNLNGLLGPIANANIWSTVAGIGAGALVKLANAIDDNLDAMNKDSKTLKSLYEAEPSNIPYHLIAGNTQDLRIQLSDSESKLSKLLVYLKDRGKIAAYDLLTSQLFKESNDIAVSQSSMQKITSGDIPLKTQ
ncbi:MAG: PGAP1-like protein, partial [uncultured Thiotrichaceae bacterium]